MFLLERFIICMAHLHSCVTGQASCPFLLSEHLKTLKMPVPPLDIKQSEGPFYFFTDISFIQAGKCQFRKQCLLVGTLWK